MLLKGKTAVLTGCNRGIGRAVLALFAQHGANIWACVRKETEEFVSLARELSKRYRVTITPVYFDFGDEEQIKAGLKVILASKSHVDILVNNAGVVPSSQPFHMTSIGDMKKTFDINFFAQMLITQYISRIMAKKKSGSIVNISSIAGMDGNPAQLEYVASKSAMIGATKKLAIELGTMGIRVNAVAPGLTDTDMIEKMDNDFMKKNIDKVIMKRLGRPEEIAAVVLFLASELSSFITGEVIRVDGGRV